MRRFPDMPVRALLVFAAVVAALHLASRHPGVLHPLGPDLLGMALFLYMPLLHYRRGRPPAWIRAGNARRSLLTAAGLALLGTLLYLVYVRLPLPQSLLPPLLPRPPLAEFLARQALVAALPEEVFFRGYLYDAFEEAGWEPVAASSVLFALAHVAIHATPYRALTLLPGIAFGWARKSTGGIYVPIVLHLVFNILPYAVGSPR